jgi:hypothetical protein
MEEDDDDDDDDDDNVDDDNYRSLLHVSATYYDHFQKVFFKEMSHRTLRKFTYIKY